MGRGRLCRGVFFDEALRGQSHSRRYPQAGIQNSTVPARGPRAFNVRGNAFRSCLVARAELGLSGERNHRAQIRRLGSSVRCRHLSLTHRISTGIPEVQTSHQWRLAISKRLRVPQLSQIKIAVSAFFRVLTPSESDCEPFLRATCDFFYRNSDYRENRSSSRALEVC
jgi:hypothetical protein